MGNCYDEYKNLLVFWNDLPAFFADKSGLKASVVGDILCRQPLPQSFSIKQDDGSVEIAWLKSEMAEIAQKVGERYRGRDGW